MEPTEQHQAFLDFLNDDLMFGTEQLDAGTLAAVCAVETQHGEQSSTQRKRSRAASFAADDYIKEDPDDDRDSGEDKSDGKRSCKQDPTKLARSKACREKARREKLNDRFSELAQLVEPGAEPKTDKLSIINDAIKYVTQMKVENSQLKQLNKFLEERVAHLEKERSQMMYQQALLQGAAQQQASMQAALMQQGGMMQQGAVMQQGGLVPGLLQAGGMQGLAPGALQPLGQQQLLQAQQEGLLAQSGMMMQPGAAFSMPIKQGTMDLGSAAGSAVGVANGAAAGMAAAGGAGVGGMGMPNGCWVPPSMLDASRDSALRPPAA